MRKFNLSFIAFILVTFVFNSFSFSQNYSLAWSRFSSGGGAQTGTNYGAELSSIGGVVRFNFTAEGGNFGTQSVVQPDSLPPAPFTGGVSMVAIPLNVETKNPATLLGAGFSDSARWAPEEKAYHLYSKDPNDALLQISPGRGYWLKIDSSMTVTVYGTFVPSNSDYGVSLKAGWNQIGNPFNFNVNLSDVKVSYQGTTKTLSEAAGAGWLGEYAYSYTNQTTGYQLIHPTVTGAARVLEPWLGYWVNCAVDVELIIPPTKAVKAKESIAADAGRFSVVLAVSSENSGTRLLVGKANPNEYIPKPPDPVNGKTSAYLINGSGKYLAEFNDSLNYEFVVLAQPNEKVTISVEQNGMPKGYSVYVLDTVTNKEINLSESPYSFIADGTEKRFKAQITKAEKELFTQSLNLDEVMIYPNPIRGNVSVNSNVNIVGKFSMGLPVYAEMEFYNTAGKLIQKEPLSVNYGGKGKVKLDTQNTNNVFLQLPNGVYFVRVTFQNATGEKVSKVVKVVVVK